jgi:hypothetical protein
MSISQCFFVRLNLDTVTYNKHLMAFTKNKVFNELLCISLFCVCTYLNVINVIIFEK